MSEFCDLIAEFSEEMIIKAIEDIDPHHTQHNITVDQVDADAPHFVFTLDDSEKSGCIIEGQVCGTIPGQFVGSVTILDLFSETMRSFTYGQGQLRRTESMRWGNA